MEKLMTNFNLSEKLCGTEDGYNFIKEDDVKEFIRLIKKSNIDNWQKGLEKMEEEIDKLSGEKIK